MTQNWQWDLKTVVVHATRLVVLGGLLAVALAGCGKDERDATVMRGRFRSNSKPRGTQAFLPQSAPTTPQPNQRGPLN